MELKVLIYYSKVTLNLREKLYQTIFGVEYKRAFKNGYFFVHPSYEANIYSNATETKIVFLGNTISL